MIGRVRIGLVIAGCLAGIVARAAGEPAAPPAGDAVALLPLDTDRSLEIYGQPVASELARALVAGSVSVVVVGPKMAVPERARLIIDGTIALGKASAITISLRIRNTLDGIVLETLSATAPGLANIDSAAAELSARILPLVRDWLAAIQRPSSRDDRSAARGPAPAADRPMLVAITDAGHGAQAVLHGALDAAVADWALAQHRPIEKLDPRKLDRKIAVASVAAARSDLAVGFWILDYVPETGALPMARARVRVQITDARAVRFDRVVVTDTVLGDPGLRSPELASRVAREVLAILRPHLLRNVPSWQ